MVQSIQPWPQKKKRHLICPQSLESQGFSTVVLLMLGAGSFFVVVAVVVGAVLHTVGCLLPSLASTH